MDRSRYFSLVLFMVLGPAPASAAEPLTTADIPANVSPELRRLIEDTFAGGTFLRARAAGQLGAMRERAAPAVPFLMRLLDDSDLDDDGRRRWYARDAIVAIGEPGLLACIARVRETASRPSPPGSGHWTEPAIECLGRFDDPRAVDALLYWTRMIRSSAARPCLPSRDAPIRGRRCPC